MVDPPGRERVVTQEDKLRVIVRVRPSVRVDEDDVTNPKTIRIRNATALIFDPSPDETPHFSNGVNQNFRDISKRQHKSTIYNFHQIFGPRSTNEDIYNEGTKDLLDKLLSGYNCSVFVYGATGAGKTFTMLGNENNYGITYLTMKDLYKKVNEQKDSKKFEIYVSYLEVYNEKVYDLLVKDKIPLFLRQCGYTTSVAGITIKIVNNVDELIEMLRRGNAKRELHPTDANSESSRSHALFQVYIKITSKHTDQVKMAKLSMVDLAGSERATANTARRFKEGSNINKSLLALGNCVKNLANGLKHIPYRDSKLTRLLKDSLSGNCRTVMISCLSPVFSCYADTNNTLKFASRAMKIKSNLKENVMSIKHPESHYTKIIFDLENEKKHLLKMNEEAMNSILPDNLEDLKSTLESLFARKLKKHREILHLESVQKITELKIFLKKYLLERASLFNLQNTHELMSELNQINIDIQQFESSMNSLSTELSILRDGAIVANNELNSFVKKLETNNVKQFLDVDIVRLSYQVIIEDRIDLSNHKNQFGMILFSNCKTSHKLIAMLAEKATQDYTLLEASNNVPGDMKKNYTSIEKLLLGDLKRVSVDLSPGNQCKIKTDVFSYLSQLNIENLTCIGPEFSKPLHLEECMNPLQMLEEKLQQLTIKPEINKMDSTVVISSQAQSLKNTCVLKQVSANRLATTTPLRNKPIDLLKQNLDKVSANRLATTKPHPNKPIGKHISITRPAFQRKKLIIPNGPGNKKMNLNQKNLPLIMAASRTLAGPTLAKGVTKPRINSNNMLTDKSADRKDTNKAFSVQTQIPRWNTIFKK